MYKKKIEVIQNLKRYLSEDGFEEVLTPVLRKDCGKLIPRIRLENGFALRDSHELQLRYLLTEYTSIYEIGSCFRYEPKSRSDTNLQEFLLMELFTSKYKLSDLMNILKKFILKYKPATIFKEVSIANYIKEDLDIDLRYVSQDELYKKLKILYKNSGFSHDYEYVLHYIEEKLEQQTIGQVVFLTEYPECTCSYAKITCGNIISRFELFANGIELANGFDDECCPALFQARNKTLPIFSSEEKAIICGLSEGKLPPGSSGVGIGIERLCMFLFEQNDINVFKFPSDNF